VFDDAAELDGLSAGELSAAARAAAERGLDGKHLLTLPLFTGHPALARSRTARAAVAHAASRSRGARGGATTTARPRRDRRRRAERAALLGYPSHAAA
jgi:peptidyl-dipeptidase Dcp